MRTNRAVALTCALCLAGCDAVSDFESTVVTRKMIDECADNITNRCADSMIDYRIQSLRSFEFVQSRAVSALLDHSKPAASTQKADVVLLFGEPGWSLYQEATEEARLAEISWLESRRSDFFTRWFKGNALSEEEPVPISFNVDVIQDEIDRLFMEKIKMAGLLPEQSRAVRYAGARQAVDSAVDAALDDAIQALADQRFDSTGSEISEARQVLRLDLNADGGEDAVALISVEERSRKMSSQIIAVFLYDPQEGWTVQDSWFVSAGWVLQPGVVVDGAVQLQATGLETISLKSLSRSETDPLCCPSGESLESYRWNRRSRFFEKIEPAG